MKVMWNTSWCTRRTRTSRPRHCRPCSTGSRTRPETWYVFVSAMCFAFFYLFHRFLCVSRKAVDAVLSDVIEHVEGETGLRQAHIAGVLKAVLTGKLEELDGITVSKTRGGGK